MTKSIIRFDVSMSSRTTESRPEPETLNHLTQEDIPASNHSIALLKFHPTLFIPVLNIYICGEIFDYGSLHTNQNNDHRRNQLFRQIVLIIKVFRLLHKKMKK